MKITQDVLTKIAVLGKVSDEVFFTSDPVQRVKNGTSGSLMCELPLDLGLVEDEEISIGSISKFLQTLKLFNVDKVTVELEERAAYNDKVIKISEGSNSCYFPMFNKTHMMSVIPKKTLAELLDLFGDPKFQFSLTEGQSAQIKKAGMAVAAEHIIFENKDSTFSITVGNAANSADTSYSLVINENSESDFRYVVPMQYFIVEDGDYKVDFYEGGRLIFNNSTYKYMLGATTKFTKE